MNKISQIHFVRIIAAVFFVRVGFAVGQTVLILLRFAFSMTNTGITNLVAVR
jgi:hypothetical protein